MKMTNTTEEQIQQSLARAFNLVANAADWKAPIDAYVTSDQLRDVYEAIEYFTATKPRVEYIGIMTPAKRDAFPAFQIGQHIIRIQAQGYRNGPAGDH